MFEANEQKIAVTQDSYGTVPGTTTNSFSVSMSLESVMAKLLMKLGMNTTTDKFKICALKIFHLPKRVYGEKGSRQRRS